MVLFSFFWFFIYIYRLSLALFTIPLCIPSPWHYIGGLDIRVLPSPASTLTMGVLSLVEDRPTPKEVYNWRIYLLAAVASCTSCMIGYDSAFIGTTIQLDSFKDEFNWDDMSPGKQDLVSANIVSLYQAGAFFGAFFAYPIGHFWGRKWGLMCSALVFTLGAGLMLGANGDRGLGLIYGGRVLAGLGVGAGSNITPIYISELAPPAIRGRLVGVYELGWQIGGLVGFWICVSSRSKGLYRERWGGNKTANGALTVWGRFDHARQS